MKTMLKLATCTALSVALMGCGGDDAAPTSSEAAEKAAKEAVAKKKGPAETIDAAFDALEKNDVNTFLALVLPEARIEEMRKEFKEEQDPSEITDEMRAEFDQTVSKFTADNAEEQLMAELEPQLAEMGPQIPMMMGFGQMMLQSSIQENQDLDDTQKQQAMDAGNALFTKLQGVNLADKELAKKAIGVVTKTARELDLTTLDALYEKSFDEALYMGGQVMGGTKELLNVYGLDLNSVLASTKATVVEKTDDTATVEISYDLFGSPQTTTTEMTMKDGRWFSADMIEQLEKAQEMEESMEAEPMEMEAAEG